VLGAVALGARVFEKHFTDDNLREGPDHKFAMNPQTWREMVTRAAELDAALGDGVKRVESNEADTAIVQRRALRYTRNLPAGHRLAEEDLFPLRPIPKDGIAPYDIDTVIGQVLSRPVQADDLTVKEDLC
jgi:N-acetylneuraminate synthase